MHIFFFFLLQRLAGLIGKKYCKKVFKEKLSGKATRPFSFCLTLEQICFSKSSLFAHALQSQLLDSLPYFSGYKIEFFSFQNNLKNLDPFYKADLDLWDFLGR